MVKNPPAIWETWVQSLSWEDPLEEGVATHSSILAWKIPWTEELRGLQYMGSHRVRHDCSNLAHMRAVNHGGKNIKLGQVKFIDVGSTNLRFVI